MAEFNTARAEEFLRRRIAGETLKAIADDYGICIPAVRQAVLKLERKRREAPDPHFTLDTPLEKCGLSVRAVNCLKGEHLRIRRDGQAPSLEILRDTLRLTDAELLRIPNFGRKCVDELREMAAVAAARTSPPTSALVAARQQRETARS